MIIFDLLLLLAITGLLAVKSLYLGMVTLVIGLLIHFQSMRTQFLLGRTVPKTSVTRKVKAVILALIIGAAVLPFLLEKGQNSSFETEFNSLSVLPIIIVIGIFTAATMAALAVEKRKR